MRRIRQFRKISNRMIFFLKGTSKNFKMMHLSFFFFFFDELQYKVIVDRLIERCILALHMHSSEFISIFMCNARRTN